MAPSCGVKLERVLQWVKARQWPEVARREGEPIRGDGCEFCVGRIQAKASYRPIVGYGHEEE